MKKIILLGSMMSCFLFATEADQVTFGEPVTGGSLCPAGTVSHTPSPDNKSLSLIFDDASSLAGGETDRSYTRDNCMVSIPVSVPDGFRVAVVGADWRGFKSLTCGADAEFSVEYFLAGQTVEPINHVFEGPDDEDFTLQHSIKAEDLFWSGCGQDTNLRANVNTLLRSNNRHDEVEFVVDSADIVNRHPDAEHGHTYHFIWDSCEDETSGASAKSAASVAIAAAAAAVTGVMLKAL